MIYDPYQAKNKGTARDWAVAVTKPSFWEKHNHLILMIKNVLGLAKHIDVSRPLWRIGEVLMKLAFYVKIDFARAVDENGKCMLTTENPDI